MLCGKLFKISTADWFTSVQQVMILSVIGELLMVFALECLGGLIQLQSHTTPIGYNVLYI